MCRLFSMSSRYTVEIKRMAHAAREVTNYLSRPSRDHSTFIVRGILQEEFSFENYQIVALGKQRTHYKSQPSGKSTLSHCPLYLFFMLASYMMCLRCSYHMTHMWCVHAVGSIAQVWCKTRSTTCVCVACQGNARQLNRRNSRLPLAFILNGFDVLEVWRGRMCWYKGRFLD